MGSMKVVVAIDLIATMILPASYCYAGYLMFEVFFNELPVSTVLLVLYGIIMAVQVVVFILRSRWDYIWWFTIYFTVGLPVFTSSCQCTLSGIWTTSHGVRRARSAAALQRVPRCRMMTTRSRTSSRRRSDFTTNKRNSARVTMPHSTRARVGAVVEAATVAAAGQAAAAMAAGIARITQGLMTVEMAKTLTVLVMIAA